MIKHRILKGTLAFFIVFGAVTYYVVYHWYSEPTCPTETRQCSDGSLVHRDGPFCDFSECPTIPLPPTPQKTFTDKSGLTFQYPEQFPTTYIREVDWPPKVKITSGEFVCKEDTTNPGKKTEKRTVGGREYCVKESIEGAAGSTYTTYEYSFLKNNKIATLTFTDRASQCGNYESDQKDACDLERESFNIDAFVDSIASTVTFSAP
jgi:hypothetical protein